MTLFYAIIIGVRARVYRGKSPAQPAKFLMAGGAEPGKMGCHSLDGPYQAAGSA
jgi:hypothetical protein